MKLRDPQLTVQEKKETEDSEIIKCLVSVLCFSLKFTEHTYKKRGDLFTNSANVLHVLFFSLKGEALNQYMRNPSAPDNSAPMCHFGLEKVCLSYNDLHCFMLDL